MWTILVWTISAICYVPLFIYRQGIAVPSVMLNLKYFFVLVPLFFTFGFLFRKKGIKKWITGMFECNMQSGALIFCLMIAVAGILFTNLLTMQEWKLQTSAAGIAYLFLMALIEEAVWRGYRLTTVAKSKKEMSAIGLVSLQWAVWHIPMWTVRNAIGIEELAFWILYTVIVGSILGKAYIRYRNILVPVILHTIFNVFFLMPIPINLVVVLSILIATTCFEKAKKQR